MAEQQDGLTVGKARGRGAGLNPGNRFEDVRLHVLGEHLDKVLTQFPDGTQVITRVYPDKSKSVLNENDSPDIPFRWSLNPYRGCEHGCIYCYARPGHEYLGLSCGLDFETRIFAKTEAPRLLREALNKKSWEGETIVMSGVTDPYQPIEAKLRITRACLDGMAEMGQPVSIITKNRLVVRDTDLLAELARHNAARVAISITSLDHTLAAKMEPRASSPRERLAAVRELTDAGIPVHVMTAPIIPGLNDHEIPKLLEAAAEAGAVGAGYVLLRLPYQIKALFLEWLKRHFPDRAAKVEGQIRDSRDGDLYQSDWYERQSGTGHRAEGIQQTFRLFAKRHGLEGGRGGSGGSNATFLRRREERSSLGPTLFDLF